MFAKRLFILFVFLLSGGKIASSYANENIDAFIERVKTVTYDCPNTDDFQQLEAYLASDSLSSAQRLALSVERSHFLICEGQVSEAQSLLFDVTAWPDIDKSSYFFASAIYQIGFTYDLREQPERCGYYEQAQALAEDKFSDVYLSATMGLITNCEADSDAGERLGKMFIVLEKYSATKDYQALAHIHNSIGLVYGGLQQHVLAAEQYLKAHEMGLKVYTGSNQLTILISAITSLFASGQYDRAYETIQEFERINQNVGTPLTNFFYAYALAGYYYRIEDIEKLKLNLPELKRTAEQTSNPVFHTLSNWLQTVPCVYEKDIQCLEDYLAQAEAEDSASMRFIGQNLEYQKFRVDIAIAMGDLQRAENTFADYAKNFRASAQKSQSSASILSVANLYSKVYELESEVEKAERLRRNTLVLSIILFLVLGSLTAYIIRKKHLARMAIDPATQLLNSEIAISRIEQTAAPDSGKTNALALLDLSNLRELTIAAGSAKSDTVLREISDTLRNVTRESDILGRFGPEQFILCLPNIEESSATSFFERVQNELDGTSVGNPNDESINVRTSMSIFIATEKFSDLSSVIDEMVLSFSVKAKR